jgi:hypothetical protein
VDRGQQTGVIGVNPAVKMQSSSAVPEIATASPSGGQVPMADDVPIFLGHSPPTPGHHACTNRRLQSS